MITRYVRSRDGTSIAARLYGEPSAPPLLTIPPWTAVQWTQDLGVSINDRFAARRYLIGYDRRGTGSSARDPADLGIEAQIDDALAVISSLSVEAVEVIAFFDASMVAIALAGRHPERVRKLVLWHPFVRGEQVMPPERVHGLVELARNDFALASRTLATLWAPRATTDAQRALARGFQKHVSPEMFGRYLHTVLALDVEEDARNVKADTLILTPSGAGLATSAPQQAAALIAGAVLQQVEQKTSFANDERVPQIMLQFLDGTAAVPAAPTRPSGGTAVILFTDIADSTALTERMGDEVFRVAARALDERLRAAIRESHGTPVEGKLLGDGVLATFTSARDAVTAARRCVELSAESELRLHVGLHAGDVLREEDNVYGGAVNIASRICALCEPGEILVSQTVRDLARTSAGVTFEDRGAYDLKGIEDAVRVFAVQA
jgi:class 3 adenylate cyclase